ncbi:hypothetical protein MTE01_26100 [Microbacterium testaceum]|uniref:Uncharacterized protein n=1 Tax=Microbacterium testaceum TaxID=2033 RepID=A0A4Y3QN36_MICTE|nr:hypothetical protein [Microbacterium testaceum]GEB46665.1 hypothetical protein MTE01_26100 [Microbacterium testaceum]
MASRSIDPVPPEKLARRAQVLAFVLAPIFAVVAVMYLWIGLDEPTLLAGGVTVGLLSVLWLLAAVRPSPNVHLAALAVAGGGGVIAAVVAFASISATNGLSVTYLIGVVINIAIGYFFVRLTVRALSAP